jgi:Uma2 family endonuclease
MSERAMRRMTLEEFLRWDDGTDTRYELIGGFPVAMAPPARAHGILCARLGGMIDTALRSRRPCAAQIEAGVARVDRDDSVYIADIAVSCRPYRQGEQLVRDPILIVEILSPSTERNDRRLKLPAYQEIGSVGEIVLIDADSHHPRSIGATTIVGVSSSFEAPKRRSLWPPSVSVLQCPSCMRGSLSPPQTKRPDPDSP